MKTNSVKQNRELNYNQLADEYAVHRKVQPKVFEQLILASGIGSESRVLEVGCGTGNYISAIHAATGAASWGIDPSAQMLARARESITGVDFQDGRGEVIGFPENCFGLVYSVDVIHHMQNRERYFQEAFRVLNPGGLICTVTETSWMIRNRQPFAVYFPETVPVDLQRYPSSKALKNIMEAASFNDIRSKVVKFSFLHADIQDFRDKAYSCLHLISEACFQQGMLRMEEDLIKSPIPWISRYLLVWGMKANDHK